MIIRWGLISALVICNLCTIASGFDGPSASGNSHGPFVINAAIGDAPSHDRERQRRNTPTDTQKPDSNIITKINFLNDTHKQLMVHWVRNNSQIVVCLARDPAGTLEITPSNVYISYDDGNTYENKTELFKLENGTYSNIEKFYSHSKYTSHILFNDIANKLLYVTNDAGLTIRKIHLNFTPNDVTFHENHAKKILVYDSSDEKRTLWLTEDFGQSWRMIQEYVKSYFWLDDNNGENHVVVERVLPSNMTTVFYMNQQQKLNIYALDVENVYMKGDYIFTSMKSKRHSHDIYVSYRFGIRLKCAFDTNLDIVDYLVVDVTGNRAFIAITHSSTLSNLYVSENLGGSDDKVHFTLSLPNVLAHFPNTTWRNSWLHLAVEESFADVYKVEGVQGVYIASQVINVPTNNNLSPHHLGSRITFNHGGSWRPIMPPQRDMEGQLTSCYQKTNCSLHLSQRFSQLYPDTKSISILSSKSAPGIIIATGVMGESLRGHFGVYISTDAGITWRHSLRDYYFFNIGDHGGLMTAAKNLRMRGETRHVLYSTDEGGSWQQTPFHNEEIRVYGLMTEPGEATPVITLFGSLPDQHKWMIVKIDLRRVFKFNCSDDPNNNYKWWSPLQKDENNKYVPCILGQQKRYRRRIPTANCYNGIDFEMKVEMRQCECEQLDYECDFGFVRTGGEHWHCIKNTSYGDVYYTPISCSPGAVYNRTKGYRKISGDVCLDGYVNQFQPDIIPCPTKHVNNMLLFAQRDKIVKVDLVTLKQQPVDIPGLKNVIAIDFDLSNNCIYWADIITDTIARFCYEANSPVETLVSSELSSVEGMALDWVSKNLYFVDGLRAKIELVRTDIRFAGRMRKTILDSNVLTKPRGIAVHPRVGYLYWTDWALNSASVKRSNLDGTEIKIIADKKLVEWPNGITIDYIAERVYWADARRDYIGSSNLDGKGFKKVPIASTYVSHPFSVAAFKDDLYWDDWQVDSVFMTNKDAGGHVRTLIANTSGLMYIKVIAHGTQQGTNKCAQSPSLCTHICVGSPIEPFYTCLCPDGMEQKDGDCFCPGGFKPSANYTCPQINGACAENHIVCKNGRCIPKGWECNHEDDCGDNSDEENCGAQTCPSNYFVCGDGKCIPHYWKCDYEPDCVDGSDELNCARHNCSSNQFRCTNGRCISERWRCDGENDCRDNSDEKNCATTSPEQCKEDEFQCRTGNTRCISASWRCDNEHDCKDGSDEEGCKNSTCTDFQFSCSGPNTQGECIYMSWVCDGDIDCRNGADETNCTSIERPSAPPYINPFVPNNGSVCQEWMFTCANHKCIPIWWKCDHANDCEDGSDELGCNFESTTAPMDVSPTWKVQVCSKNQFQCTSGDCISMAWVCDNSKDCPDGDDEHQCDTFNTCEARKMYRCRVDGNCIHLSDVCNGKRDCPDGSDEEFCATPNKMPGTAAPSCSVGYFPCDYNRCFPLASMCDLKHDCNDGFDEGDKCANMTRVYQVLQMGVDSRSVNDSSFLLYWWISLPEKLKLEYLPSVSSTKDHIWKNTTWTGEMDYRFDHLQPFTTYNMTVYVRVNGSNDTISPPAKYFSMQTGEGQPSEPYNLTVVQRNNSDVFLSWNKPLHPNGIILAYEVTWYPPERTITYRMADNSTSLMLTADFEPNTKYSFYVVAISRSHTSAKSEIVTLDFHSIDAVSALRVENRTNSSILLSWKCTDEVDGFIVIVDVKFPFPKQPSHIVTKPNIKIQLPPGMPVTFKISAFKGLFTGPPSSISTETKGDELPTITIHDIGLHSDYKTAAHLTWLAPRNYENVSWVYGVYYGITSDELFEKPRYNTTEVMANIYNLTSCEAYLFAVGVIAPLGYGPLEKNPPSVFTYLDVKQPPKKVSARMNPNNPKQMLVQWSPSCPKYEVKKQVGYIVEITDTVKNVKNTISLKDLYGVELSKVFNVSYGGVYEIKVRTNSENSIFAPTVIYNAPPIMPPHGLTVIQEMNGSFVLYWTERNFSMPESEYTYEVLVSEGTEMNMTTASRYRVKRPPFLFNNQTGAAYTFAVRTRTNKGYRSVLSERQTSVNEALPLREQHTGSSVWQILVPVTLLLVSLFGALAFLAMRYRRLQNSFKRFANSHYDTRSGAATFDDNILDEDDTPQIRGFSDDEPLVVA